MTPKKSAKATQLKNSLPPMLLLKINTYMQKVYLYPYIHHIQKLT